MKKKRLLTLISSICLVLVLVALLLPACAKEEAPATPTPTPVAKPIVWKFANYSVLGSPWNDEPQWFFQEIEKRSGGRLKVDMHLAQSLCPIKEQPEAIKSGLCQFTVIVPPYYWAKVPLCEGVCYPFVMPGDASQKGIRATFSLADMYFSHPNITKELAAWDAMYLVPHGFTQYSIMSNKPIRTVEDFKGIKIRATGPLALVLEEFDAVPVFVAGPEGYSALQTGVIDAFAHGAFYVKRFKTYEVSKYFIDGTFMGTTMDTFVVKKSAFEALPEDLQKIMEEVKDEALLRFADAYYNDEKGGREFMTKSTDMEIIHFPPEERAKMTEVAKEAAWEVWIAKTEEKGLPAREMLDWLLDECHKMGY